MYKKLSIILVFLALFIPFSAFSWGMMEDFEWDTFFDRWNGDNNDYLSEEEFRTGFNDANIFARLDDDGDGMLGMAEFNTIAYNIFEAWDESEDGQVGTTEWVENPVTRGRALDWDENSNGLINRGEFSRGLYEALDTNENGTLEPDEVTMGLFNMLDLNENDQLSREEFGAIHPRTSEFYE